jgi:SAM-dependent methyltransferase
MAEYKYFATVYDRMMDDIPYEEWEQYILLLLCRYGVEPCSRITELGCGTGTMSELLAEDGFQVTGIDLSKEMLDIAIKKGRNDISYICADMRDFVLPEKQSAVISICDSMNYLLTEDDLTAALTCGKKCLEPGGIFIFDLKTEYFFKNSYDGITFADDLGDFSYVWQNRYDEEARIHEYRIRFRIKEEQGYRFEKELHRQRTFRAEEIKAATLKAGFRKAVAYDAFTLDKPRKNSERIYIVCL